MASNPSVHNICYSPPSTSVGAVDCSKVIACLTPGSIPSTALSGPIALALLASGALPVGIAIAPAQVTPGTFGPGALLPSSQLTGVIPSANLPPTTHTTTWDPVGNTYTSVVNGVSAVSNLGSLDDEGVTIAIIGGVLQLKNRAGVIIGSTPVPDSDGQLLSLAATTANIAIALTNGGSVAFNCKDIYSLFKSNPAVPALAVELLGDDCQKHSIKAVGEAIRVGFNLASGPLTSVINPTTGAITLSLGGVSSPSFTPVIPAGPLPANVTLSSSQLTGVISAANLPPTTHTLSTTGTGATRSLTSVVNGVSATVPLSDADQQQLSISGSVISLSNGGSVVIPTSPPAPTTHVNSWTQAGGLQESVNGVASNIAIPLGIPVTVLGYNAAGAPVFAPVVPTVKVRETQVNVAAGASVPTQYSGPTLITPYTAQYDVRSLFIVDGPNATIVLTPPVAALTGEITGVEFDIKLLGAWVGGVTIAPSGGALIDGSATATFSKTAATQPSRSIRWIAPNWIFV